MHYLHS